jgi:hypothetical protein
MTKEQANKAAPNFWQMLIGNKFDTAEKKGTFLDWCASESCWILYSLSSEEVRIYSNQMWSAYDAISRPQWLEKEKAYYAELQEKDKVSEFTSSGPDSKTDGRKLVCFVYRRCIDGSTTPEEAAAYMKKAIIHFEKATKH